MAVGYIREDVSSLTKFWSSELIIIKILKNKCNLVNFDVLEKVMPIASLFGLFTFVGLKLETKGLFFNVNALKIT